MKIDPFQSDAIRHESGPAMVLAGPGSGKTTVITHRVMYMISHLRIDPASILVITFSRAASRQMRERFLLLCGRQRFPVTFGTFHAIFFQILKNTYGYTSENIVRADRQSMFVREYVRRLRLEVSDESELTRNILSEISRIKSTQADVRDCRITSCETEPFRLIYEAYEEFLRRGRLLDFDDMLVMTKRLFVERPDILAGWQERFDHILVDEFQDINPLQYDIVRMLALPGNNLFIVGDDDQSIYRFRGAEPEIMMRFEQDYPGAEKIGLRTNYRSTPQIVEAAGNLIAHNEKRFKKEIRASSAGGAFPVREYFRTQREQNLYVMDTVQRLYRETGIPYHEMAVLFRTNAQSSLLMTQFSARNIPFISKERIPCLFEHWIAKDVAAYLSIAMGDRSRTTFLRVMNRPNRCLSRESLPFEEVSFSVWRQYYRGERSTLGCLDKLEADLSVISRLRPYSAVNYIRMAVGYEDYLREFERRNHMPEGELIGVLDEIQSDAAEYDSCGAWLKHQDSVRAESEKKAAGQKGPESAVVFSTIHGAKGLEYDTVFLVDVDEAVLPDKKAVTIDELEEERRLFYVGMTRAKRRLFLLHSGQIKNKTMAPSRFLEECETRPEQSFNASV